jgi:hypothetical protein
VADPGVSYTSHDIARVSVVSCCVCVVSWCVVLCRVCREWCTSAAAG